LFQDGLDGLIDIGVEVVDDDHDGNAHDNNFKELVGFAPAGLLRLARPLARLSGHP
jgi:hypothetical protein